MKNMKISLKLIVSFSIVIVLAIIVAMVGIIGMRNIKNADEKLYNMNLIAIYNMGLMNDNFSLQRMNMRNIVIYDAGDETFKTSSQALSDLDVQMKQYSQIYEATITEDSDRKNFNDFMSLYNNFFRAQLVKDVVTAGTANESEKAQLAMDTAAPTVNQMNELLQESLAYNADEAGKAVAANTSLFNTMTITEIIILIIAVFISIGLAMYISSLIGKPMGRIKQLMDQVGNTGELQIEPGLYSSIQKDMLVRDEIGQSMVSFNLLIGHITKISDQLQILASGDLTGNITTLSDKDVLGVSLVKMQDSLNSMFGEINSSANQVSTGSVQIADGAQLLAQGATEQSATVEQLSASITEISGKTKANADLATEARNLGESIKANAERGNQQMEQMIQAVGEINEASQSIGKVIKIIDDIAFQTNILALNAAVEAARAGQHGKGFAVVADEVRSLAAKSAEAAKNTSELIATSIQKSEMGASISQETAESLKQIVEGIVHNSELVGDIASSSNEQAIAISQVSEGIGQVSQVVQQNSATAEQSAAASEEMSGQATLLQELISRFKLKNNVNSPMSRSYSAPEPQPISYQSTGISLSSSKY